MKFKLEDVKVKSFITTLDKYEGKNARAGAVVVNNGGIVAIEPDTRPVHCTNPELCFNDTDDKNDIRCTGQIPDCTDAMFCFVGV